MFLKFISEESTFNEKFDKLLSLQLDQLFRGHKQEDDIYIISVCFKILKAK
jgi:hypothetical protein